jgi:hypothetical protein
MAQGLLGLGLLPDTRELKSMGKGALKSVGLLDEAKSLYNSLFNESYGNVELGNLTEAETAAALVGKDKRVDPTFILEQIIKPISYHESKGTFNPNIIQDGTSGNPKLGRGLMQFEKESFKTAVQRARNYLERNKLSQPDWLKNINKEKQIATSLTGDQQMALAIYDLKEKAGADISKVFSGEQNITNFWLENWWKGEEKDKKDRKASFESHLETYRKRFNVPSLDSVL